MIRSLSKRLPVWLVLLSCSIAFCQVSILEAPRFAEAGQALKIQAFVDDKPVQVRLTWVSDTQTEIVNMALNVRGYWTGAIGAHAVQGKELSYAVIADYDQGPTTTTPDYSLEICPTYTLLKPETMELKKTVLAQKKWHGDDKSFGLYKPEQGPAMGPASIACHKGNIYLLDTVKKRVLCFDKAGKSHPAVDIPTSKASDLIIDSTDDSLMVVSQLEDKIYRFRNGKLKNTQSARLKEGLEYPAKFCYDRHSKMLFAERQNRRKNLVPVIDQKPSLKAMDQPISKDAQILTEVQGDCLIVKIDSDSRIFAVDCGQAVAYIDEEMVDDNGIVWILYTLKGDYRIRRLARIDTTDALAETTQINVWFPFYATRRMTLTDNGVALMAGDLRHGRIVVYDYAGGVQ